MGLTGGAPGCWRAGGAGLLIEHVFVTTMDAEEALLRAQAYLAGAGFGQVVRDGSSLIMRAGRAAPLAHTSFREWPQEVRIEFDRGRVAVAASIREAKKPHPVHRDMLLALVRGLEQLLVQRVTLDAASVELARAGALVDAEFDDRRRARRLRGCGCLVLVTLLVAAMVAAIVAAGR